MKRRKLSARESLELHHRVQGVYLPAMKSTYDAFDPHSMRQEERRLARAYKRLSRHRSRSHAAPAWLHNLADQRKRLKARIAYFDRFPRRSSVEAARKADAVAALAMKSSLPHPAYFAVGAALLFGAWWLWQRRNPPEN